MNKHELRAREIVEAWQANPGMAGEPDLETRIAQALNEERILALAEAAEIIGMCIFGLKETHNKEHVRNAWRKIIALKEAK